MARNPKTSKPKVVKGKVKARPGKWKASGDAGVVKQLMKATQNQADRNLQLKQSREQTKRARIELKTAKTKRGNVAYAISATGGAVAKATSPFAAASSIDNTTRSMLSSGVYQDTTPGTSDDQSKGSGDYSPGLLDGGVFNE